MRLRFLRAVLWCVAAVTATELLFSCSPKRNNAATRQYQAFITRYNIYFNGDEHFHETLKELESSYEDDYSKRLYMHPVEAKSDDKAPQPSGNFDRSIEKAQKAIQLRSIKKKPKKQPGKQYDEKYKEWMKRSEYNPFLHNAWMMMGRSQYFNGDFSGAAATFLYVSRNFGWLPATVTEARLWEARCYLAEDWLYEAEVIITRIKQEQLINNTLKGLYYFDLADFYIRSHRYEEAVMPLRALLKYTDGPQKMRTNFLLGQILSELGRKREAYEAYHHAASSSSADYRTKFNARIRQSEVYEGDNIEPEVKALRRMVRYDRNKEYLDQVYYAIGNLYMSRGDTVQAISAYREAINSSTRGGYDKALANLALGNIYFAQHRYDLAQPCMSEAVPLLPADYPDIALIRKRSDVLDELAVYAQNVHLQDSLLTLAALSPEEQLKVCERLAEEAKKKRIEEEEKAKREEYLAEQAANARPLPDAGMATPTILGGDDSWYFYNTRAVASGKQAFQRQWGSRKLEDNWRRRNKQQFDVSEFDSDSDDSDAEDTETRTDSEADGNSSGKTETAAADNPESAEYYLKDIPKTDLEKVTANDIVQEGLYNMGLILKDKLEDYPAALDEFNTLLTRYPDNVYRLDVYYNLYLMFVREGNMSRAENYRQLILKDFPESQLGMAMRNPDYLEHLKEMEMKQEELYEATLADYLNNRNAQVQANYLTMERDYPLSKIMPKFMFLNALTYVTENKPDEFNAALRELLERYPDTDLTPIASAYLKGMAQGRKLQQGGGNMRAMVWSTRLLASSDSTMVNPDAPLEVVLDPDAPQMLALVYPRDRVNAALLLYDVARFNFSTFVVRDFDLEQMDFGPLGILLIKGFENQRDLDRYRRTMQNSGFEFPPDVRPVPISEANFELLLRQGRSFDEYFEAIGEKIMQDTHEDVLSPEEYPAAKDMYPTVEEMMMQHGVPDGGEYPDSNDAETLPSTMRPAEPASPLPTGIGTPEEEYDYDVPVPTLPMIPERSKKNPVMNSVTDAEENRTEANDALNSESVVSEEGQSSQPEAERELPVQALPTIEPASDSEDSPYESDFSGWTIPLSGNSNEVPEGSEGE